MTEWTTIVLEYVCPSVGCILASVMFAAPVHDLREALHRGTIGSLSPIPWAWMTGNCLGWCTYGYYTQDPFVLASNLPGLILSIWLNIGAAKLQYLERWEGYQKRERESTTGHLEGQPLDLQSLITAPQERLLLRILIGWAFVIVYVGWLNPLLSPRSIVGMVVNLNLVVFYGAPLTTIRAVLRDKLSDSIHIPTMVLTNSNTIFWLVYGVARLDPVIFVPNGLGLLLGIAMMVLCIVYPRSNVLNDENSSEQNLLEDNDESNEHAESLML